MKNIHILTFLLVIFTNVNAPRMSAKDLGISYFYNSDTYASYSPIVYDFFKAHPIRSKKDGNISPKYTLYPYETELALTGSIDGNECNIKIWQNNKVIFEYKKITMYYVSNRAFMIEFVSFILPDLHHEITELVKGRHVKKFKGAKSILNSIGRQDKTVDGSLGNNGPRLREWRKWTYLPGMGLTRYPFPEVTVNSKHWDIPSTKNGFRQKKFDSSNEIRTYWYRTLVQHDWDFPIGWWGAEYIPRSFLDDYDALTNPPASRLELPYAYLFSGAFLNQKKQSAWAEHAYSAAVMASNFTKASAADIANIKYISFRELSALQQSKNHPQFGALLGLASNLNDVFLNSDPCKKECKAFYDNIFELKGITNDVENQATSTYNQVSKNNTFAFFSAMGGLLTKDVAVRQNAFTRAQTYENMASEVAISGKEALEDALSGFSINEEDLYSDLRDGAPDLALENFFLSQEILSFLVFTDKALQKEVFSALEKFANDKPNIQLSLKSLKGAKGQKEYLETLSTLKTQFSFFEKAVHVYELRGKPIPEQIQQKF